MVPFSKSFRRAVRAAVLGFAVGALSLPVGARELKDFLADVSSAEPDRRQAAIQSADQFGAAAIPALGQIAEGTNQVASIAAWQSLRSIAWHSGRKGAASGPKEVADELVKLLDAKRGRALRGEALQLLSLTAADTHVAKIAALLDDKEVGDDARMALERLTGSAALEALTKAVEKSEGQTRLNLIHSIGAKADVNAKEALVQATASGDIETVLAGLEEWSRLGLPTEERVRPPRPEGLTPAQQNRLVASHLRWADYRVAKGDAKKSMSVYGQVALASRSEQFVCAAMLGAAKANPKAALPYVAGLLTHEDRTVGLTAADILIRTGGSPEVRTLLAEAKPRLAPEHAELVDKILAAWDKQQSQPEKK